MAQELELQILEATFKTVSETHPDTLATKASLALTLGRQGYWQDAELLETQVLIINLLKWIVDNDITIVSMQNLAATFGSLEKWEKAERLTEQALQVRESVDGMEHPNTKKALEVVSYIDSQ